MDATTIYVLRKRISDRDSEPIGWHVERDVLEAEIERNAWADFKRWRALPSTEHHDAGDRMLPPNKTPYRKFFIEEIRLLEPSA